jgi:RHS repeat-associated protein
MTGVRNISNEECSAYTGSDGKYTIGPFLRGSNVTVKVTPSLFGYDTCGLSQDITVSLTTRTVNLSENSAINMADASTTSKYRIEGSTCTGRGSCNAGNAIGGVTMTLVRYTSSSRTTSVGDPVTTTAFDDETNPGWYQFTGLAPGYYRVIPYKRGYAFRPSQENVTVSSSNVTGIEFKGDVLTYSVYGTLKAGSEPLSNVSVSLNGLGGEQYTVTDENGWYIFGELSNGMYTLQIEEECIPQEGSMVVTIHYEDEEVNFDCTQEAQERATQEKQNLQDQFKKLTAVDTKAKEANNSDMETTATAKKTIKAIAETAAGSTYYYYHWDHLGTTRLVTKDPTPTDSNVVVSRHDYEPFGVEIPPYPTGDSDLVKNTHRFTGHERDMVTGYDFMHARFYADSIGRFLSVDKIGLDKKRLFNPQGWNRYVYASNNPVLRFDPNGLSDIVYDGKTNMIYLYDKRGSLVAYDYAYNNATQKKDKNGNWINKGKWPNGTYDVLDKTSPHFHGPNESTGLKPGKDDIPNGAFGPDGIIRVKPFTQADGLDRNGPGVHSGQEDVKGAKSETAGCVRTTTCMMDAIVDTMAVDPLQTVKIQNNPEGPDGASPSPSMSTIEDPTDCDPAKLPPPTYTDPESSTVIVKQ